MIFLLSTQNLSILNIYPKFVSSYCILQLIVTFLIDNPNALAYHIQTDFSSEIFHVLIRAGKLNHFVQQPSVPTWKSDTNIKIFNNKIIMGVDIVY